MIKLHGVNASGNTYKAQLLMNLLGLKFKFIEIDVSKQQHKSPEFLKLNPRGEFPVLEDGALVIWDSQAILIYLAKQYSSQHPALEPQHWYPDDAKKMARITQWLCVANTEILQNLGKARAIIKFGHSGDLPSCQLAGKQTLNWLEQHLTDQQWLASNELSIADIACYPYVALCEEGGVSLHNLPAIHRWFKRIEALTGYIDLP